MSETPTDGRSTTWPPSAPAAASALPIPELDTSDDVTAAIAGFAAPAPTPPEPTPPRVAPSGATVDDEERNRYGLLLDRAAERGLLTPGEYEVRLRELASATTVERMRQLVTELPMLETPPPAVSKRSRSSRPAPGETALLPTTTARKRSSPWFGLVLVVVVMVVALLFFAVYAHHLVHGHGTGASARHGAAAVVSALRS